ncbi:MAG: hypothetical protein JKY67_15620 [Pseudomonadales bacterium]|nr:hypothetical protein [Pseudomonadales bacterium]
MKKLISAAPKKSLEIAGAFIISAVFTFFFTFVVISSTYTVMSDEEHAELLGEIDEANIKANDREWNSNHYKEKLEEMSVSLESTQSQLSNATKALTKMNINYAETNTLLDQISKIAGKCATIKGSMSRLTCFDRIPKMIASAKENAELNYSSVEKIGYWSLTQHRTPAKKLISVFLTANAQNVTSDTDTKIKPSLNLHCDTKKNKCLYRLGI